MSCGVRISVSEDNQLTLDLYLTVHYGVSIPETAENAQKAVATAVEDMTGCKVSAVNVHVAEQHAEPLPLYSFNATVALTVSLDDDKGGSLFAENYNALWAAFDFLARDDNCVELGDEDDDTEAHVFAVDGFQLGEGDPPDFADDENGGTWTTTFAATITGRAT